MADSNPIRNQELENEVRRRTQELEIECGRKTRELLDSQTQLFHAERMVALGNLVAGLAHEIKTPLGAVANNNEVFELAFKKFAQMLNAKRDTIGQEQLQELTELLTIVEDTIRTNRMACERLVRIVRSVRSFARLDEGEWKKADIHESIESSLTLLAHELRNRITVKKDYGAAGALECYPDQIGQVLLNILMNAIQAIEGP
jgi:signal transduction histidine kinase